jgi:hypothetical protein
MALLDMSAGPRYFVISATTGGHTERSREVRLLNYWKLLGTRYDRPASQRMRTSSCKLIPIVERDTVARAGPAKEAYYATNVVVDPGAGGRLLRRR